MDEIDLSWLTGEPVVVSSLWLGGLVLACILAYVVTRRLILRVIERLVRVSRTTWDDAIADAHVFVRLAHVAPAIVAYRGIEAVPGLPPTVTQLVQRIAVSLIILGVARAIGAFLVAVNTIYTTRRDAARAPIKGYLQVVKIVVYVVASVLIIATLMDRSPAVFLTGIGAMTAVVLLIFKDTILSLVASVQISGNDLIRVGDWIEMPEYGADGDVVDMALHTIKVRNWDKTITTIPTHRFLEESFKNWRGMRDTGGRRIKRALHLDVSTVRFLSDEEIERFGSWALLRDYVAEKRDELARANDREGIDPHVNADVRRMTNVGTLRAYVVRYLRAHPDVNDSLTMIVRQRDPTATGLPLEIYCFADTTKWVEYEGIQSDIFDHLIAIVPDFGLRLFQRPSDASVDGLGRALAAGDAS